MCVSLGDRGPPSLLILQLLVLQEFLSDFASKIVLDQLYYYHATYIAERILYFTHGDRTVSEVCERDGESMCMRK
jgi:hypothetical protein